MFDHIPLSLPDTPLLDTINSPADLRQLDKSDLAVLAHELREFLLYSVGQTGGHFGAGLGVIELTIALHYILQTPEDRIVWDVGHQTYPHKILTGRKNRMASIRQINGLSGFPKRGESCYDTFGVGHSSTSISAALGMAIAQQQNPNNTSQSVAVIGDGAMTAGMAFEALNHAAHTDTDLLVILNDNNMSISKNVGGLSTYFSRIWASKTYTSIREGSKRVLTKIPQAWELARKTEEHIKGMVSPGTLFEELGFYYVGPIDGHDLDSLVKYLNNMLKIKGPKILHVITQKGKGFAPAESDPVTYHALNKIEPRNHHPTTNKDNNGKDTLTTDSPKRNAQTPTPKKKKYQDVFGQWLCDVASDDDKLIGITPAMCEGSGMVSFADNFPERFHDVAIAEQHAVTFAAGLACESLKPVVAIYSTFLQRAYDQLVHDVVLQDLDVTFAVDRAGLVGEDGPTHAGSFDISFLRCLPNIILATPSDENECRQLLFSAYDHPGPSVVRYPRGTGTGAETLSENLKYPVGKGKIVRSGANICLLNFGVLLPETLKVAEQMNYSVCDMRWAKPLDIELIKTQAHLHHSLVTIEENSITGGAGSGVLELLQSEGLNTPVLPLGLPDSFIDHGKRAELLHLAKLDAPGILEKIDQWQKKLMGHHHARANTPQSALV